MKKSYLIVIVLSAFLVFSAAAEDALPEDIRFEHMGTADGLSSSSVSKIIQDRQGLLWFGTQSGLNRFDGYSIERYEHDPFDKNSLSHNLIQTMYYEDDDVLWLGTYGGLNRFDMKSGEFTWYQHSADDRATLSNNVVVAVTQSSRDELWVGTLKGLNRYDEENNRFIRYTELPNDVIRSLAVDNQGTLWVGSYGGLSRYVAEEDRFVTFTPEGGEKDSLPSPFVMSILPDPEKRELLWIGTWGGGVSKINTHTGEMVTYTLPSNEIYTMMFDSAGRLWAGTWGSGLYVIYPETGDVRSIDEASGQVIYSLLEDESGIIWIGTNGEGVYKYVPWENSFRSFVHDPKDPATISDGKIISAHFDRDGTGWFGTYNGGLNRYNPDTDTFTRYVHDPEDPNSLSNNLVNVIYRDSRGYLWIGTNGGLNRYMPESGSFRRIFSGSGDHTLPEDVVFEIAEDSSGDLWLGTNTSGVAVYSRETGSFRVLSHDPEDPRSLSDNLVRTILHDSRGGTWIGTNDGLNRYDPETDGFVRYFHDIDRPGETISSDNIREIYEDEKGRIWIATMGGGVSRYRRKDDSFSYITVEDGLASNHVLGVLEDSSGNLWFPTNRGISIYNPEEGGFRTINESNGLLSNVLTKASVRSPEGNFYIGSEKGITVIKDVTKEEQKYVPPLVITEFSVLGKQRELEQTGPHRYAPVKLDYTDSFFSLEFSLLDYSSPGQNKYAYMLEGFDDDWKQSERNYVSYTNLDAGTYTLRIIGAGSRGNWNEDGIMIPIEVLPPWWKSTAAYMGYLFLFAAGAALIFLRVRRKRLEAEARIEEKERINRELDKKVRERTAEIEKSRSLAEEASRAKTLFLANMSHEIRTPLNGLIGMLSLLSKTSLREKQKEYLEYSRISADNLNILVNDLLDFERIEAGELKLTNEKFSLREVADYIRGLFDNAFREKGLSLRVDLALGNVPEHVIGDRNRVVQVLTNLLSNALKYTGEGGVTVTISASGDREEVRYIFSVEDTGAGIAEENLESIFNHFTQIDGGYTKGSKGVGLGLAIVKQVTHAMKGTVSVESTLGEGSCFTVTLPLTPAETGKEYPIETTAARGTGKDYSHAKILICEDEAINRLYISQHLKGLGFSVEMAENGEEAVSKAMSGAYSLILMDLGMPRLSGLEAAEQIRSWENENRKKPVPVIALTAHTYGEDIQKCHEAGMDDFISKPVNESRLRKTIERWL